MGYTHYWAFEAARGDARQAELAYSLAVKQCQTLIRTYSKRHGGVSGYSAHTEPGAYEGVKLNGKGDDGHEDFVLREHFSQNEASGFCKTAGKPYDALVVGCLVLLKYYLGKRVAISSDGCATDWALGAGLASEIVGRGDVLIPESIIQATKQRVVQCNPTSRDSGAQAQRLRRVTPSGTVLRLVT